MTAYKAGKSPRKILEDHGFDINIIGEYRVWSISQHIRTEYQKYGDFAEGYHPRASSHSSDTDVEKTLTMSDEIKQLWHEVDYLKQEIELKKISSIRTTRK